ncbi:MAG: hypothetical protein JO187_10240 [Acidobacteria bacterium]|nr:hypothetical protein [Acidobacteriota bacterium]
MHRWVAGLFAVLSLVLNASAVETSARSGVFLLAANKNTTALLLIAAAVVVVLYLMRRRRRLGGKP